MESITETEAVEQKPGEQQSVEQKPVEQEIVEQETVEQDSTARRPVQQVLAEQGPVGQNPVEEESDEVEVAEPFASRQGEADAIIERMRASIALLAVMTREDEAARALEATRAATILLTGREPSLGGPVQAAGEQAIGGLVDNNGASSSFTTGE